MYVRSTPGKLRKDGSKVEYVQLAHNVWDSSRGRSQVQVIHTFGRSDRLDIEHRLTHYSHKAAGDCPSMEGKTVTAHVLRHTAAMRLLHAGVDTSVIALWLGHASLDTTQIYLHADLHLKEQALARTRPPSARTGRYQPSDSLLTWLNQL